MPDKVERASRAAIPDDVAVLFSWANLRDFGYRDFSASRQQLRAAMWQRGAEMGGRNNDAASIEKRDAESEVAQAPTETKEDGENFLQAAAYRSLLPASDLQPYADPQDADTFKTMLPARFPQRRSPRGVLP